MENKKEKKCLVKNCKNNCIIRDMCYEHGILRYKMTKYYHKIGDPLLIKRYKILHEKEEIYNFTKVQLEEYIKKLRFIWVGWNKCLYARKELSKICFEYMDNNHKLFIEKTIVPNMKIIENNLSLCYLLLTKHNNIIEGNINNSSNDNEEIKIYKTNKKKIKKKIEHINLTKRENKNDYNDLNNYIDPNIKVLSENNMYFEIKNNIVKHNEYLKDFFTEYNNYNSYNNTKIKIILYNSLYCNFINEIFEQYNLKFIKISYDKKKKNILFNYNVLLEEKDIIEELSKLRNFSDSLFEWYEKINNILVKIKENINKIYTIYMKYKYELKVFDIVNIDIFIQKFFHPLCIHIKKGNLKKLCLNNRSKTLFTSFIDIFNEIETSIYSIYIPNTIYECLSFFILNIINYDSTNIKYIFKDNILYEDNIFYKNKLLEELIYCCVESKMITICSKNIPSECLDIHKLIKYNLEKVKQLLSFGSYIYLLKYTEYIGDENIYDIDKKNIQKEVLYIDLCNDEPLINILKSCNDENSLEEDNNLEKSITIFIN